MVKRPDIGDIAQCKHGYLGLVCGIRHQPDKKGINRLTWFGVHIEPERAGLRWQSTAPKLIVHPQHFLEDENYR